MHTFGWRVVARVGQPILAARHGADALLVRLRAHGADAAATTTMKKRKNKQATVARFAGTLCAGEAASHEQPQDEAIRRIADGYRHGKSQDA